MSSFTEFIETPEAYILEIVISEHPEYLDLFIEYLTVPQSPLLCNERECYLYPSKIADLLSIGTSYRVLVEKQSKEGDKVIYPFLYKLFSNMHSQASDPTLFGYCSKILISLVKKTPEIYEFLKDNQQLVVNILKDDAKLDQLRQFVSLLLVESTMELYVFLKTMLIRNLIFRIVEDDIVGASLYRCITYFYSQIIKGMEDISEEEKLELDEVRHQFEEENFITLLILKLTSQQTSRTIHITQFLCLVSTKSKEATDVIVLHIDTILDYLEQYEESSSFMLEIRREHLSILSLVVELTNMGKLTDELVAQLAKRLLVYSNVHSKNNVIHNLLFKVISVCVEQGKRQLLNQVHIVEFFIKTTTEQEYGFMSLRRRVFAFWIEHQLDQHLDAEDRQVVGEQYRIQKEKIEGSLYYKEFRVSPVSNDLESTKIAAELPAFDPVVDVADPIDSVNPVDSDSVDSVDSTDPMEPSPSSSEVAPEVDSAQPPKQFTTDPPEPSQPSS